MTRDERDLGYLLGQAHEQERGDHVGDYDHPHQAERDVEFLGQHQRTGPQSVHQQSAQQNCGSDTAWNADGDSRDESTALDSVVGSFRRNDATNIALAEKRLVFGALHGVGIGDPIDDRSPETGQHADISPDETAAQRQPPMLECIPYAIQNAAAFHLLLAARDRYVLGSRVPSAREFRTGQARRESVEAAPSDSSVPNV